MATIGDIIRSVREYLGYPDYKVLTNPMILNALLGRISFYRTKLSLTNQNWLTNYAFLNVDSSTNEYLVPDGAEGPVGRPIKVELFDESAPYRNGPEVQIVHLQDTDLVKLRDDWWLLSNYGITGDDGNEGAYVARAICFYGIPLRCRIVPRPLQAVTYRIWHDQQTIAAPSLGTEAGLQSQFHDLLALATAKVVLPACKYDPAIAAGFASTIAEERAMYDQVFDEFRRSSRHPDTRMRRSFSVDSERR